MVAPEDGRTHKAVARFIYKLQNWTRTDFQTGCDVTKYAFRPTPLNQISSEHKEMSQFKQMNVKTSILCQTLPYIFLYSKAQTFNCRNKEKNIFLRTFKVANLCTVSCSWCNSLLWPDSHRSSGRHVVHFESPRTDLYCTHNRPLYTGTQQGLHIKE